MNSILLSGWTSPSLRPLRGLEEPIKDLKSQSGLEEPIRT